MATANTTAPTYLALLLLQPRIALGKIGDELGPAASHQLQEAASLDNLWIELASAPASRAASGGGGGTHLKVEVRHVDDLARDQDRAKQRRASKVQKMQVATPPAPRQTRREGGVEQRARPAV